MAKMKRAIEDSLVALDKAWKAVCDSVINDKDSWKEDIGYYVGMARMFTLLTGMEAIKENGHHELKS